MTKCGADDRCNPYSAPRAFELPSQWYAKFVTKTAEYMVALGDTLSKAAHPSKKVLTHGFA